MLPRIRSMRRSCCFRRQPLIQSGNWLGGLRHDLWCSLPYRTVITALDDYYIPSIYNSLFHYHHYRRGQAGWVAETVSLEETTRYQYISAGCDTNHVKSDRLGFSGWFFYWFEQLELDNSVCYRNPPALGKSVPKRYFNCYLIEY